MFSREKSGHGYFSSYLVFILLFTLSYTCLYYMKITVMAKTVNDEMNTEDDEDILIEIAELEHEEEHR